MSKNILVLSSSLRPRGNSEALADAFIQGAQAKGHSVEKISFINKTISFCTGCMACAKTDECAIKDDAVEIAKKMGTADVIVFATPIYYYEMCGQLKTMLDRANPLYGTNYSFRNIYFLATAAEKDNHAADRAISGLQGWVDCFPKATLVKSLLVGGVDQIGDMDTHASLQNAYALGQSIQ